MSLKTKSQVAGEDQELSKVVVAHDRVQVAQSCPGPHSVSRSFSVIVVQHGSATVSASVVEPRARGVRTSSQRHRCPAWQCDGVRERGRAQGLRCTCKQGRQQAKRKASIESGSLLPSTQNCRGPAKGGRGAGVELQTPSHLGQIPPTVRGTAILLG